ncbi:MAG: hypothetical protein MST05_07555 [Treponema sp.]|nr:hypothetical protein [Treponema sp.]
MRPYYLTTNNYGYYIVSFVNQETGKKTTYKSTHTKDYNQAITTVMKWYTEGVPTDNAITLKRKKETECKMNLENILGRLSEIEAKTLYEMIGAKFGFSASVQAAPLPVQTPVQTVVNTIPATTIETPKKKVVVVHKKNALADSGMIPAEIANKVYEPLNPECTMNLCEFLHNFWTPEKSEYIKNKRAHNKSIGDYHCKEMYNMVNRYWLPFFGEEFTVGELTEQYLEDFLQELANIRCLKGATINHARICGATGLKWLKNKGIIHSNPMANVEAFSKSDATPRGIPTEEDKRMIHYFNKACFLISDKKYILCVTEVLFETLGMYFKMKIVMFLTRTKQLFRPDLLITMGNVNNDIYLCRGALNVAKALNADVFELEKYFA